MTHNDELPISQAMDAPTSDETAEVEGHLIRVKGAPDNIDHEAEVAGHLIFKRQSDVPAAGDDATTSDAEVAGHTIRGRLMPNEQTGTDDRDAEVEGHVTRKGVMPEGQSDTDAAGVDDAEVAGHKGRFSATEDQPVELTRKG